MDDAFSNEISTENNTYYEILEVSPRASLQEIHNQYMKAKNAYTHDNPAVFSLLPAAECDEMLDKIEQAYFVLSSPRKRREYDLAHGIENTSKTILGGDSYSLAEAEEKNDTASEIEHRNKIAKTDISKKIVENRFNLNYTIDEEMEGRIESAQEFTGEFLKEIREYKNLTIDRLADLTKISKNYLRSIEEENFDTLPATVYVRGFIFQYAKILKISQDLATSSYIKRVKEARD